MGNGFIDEPTNPTAGSGTGIPIGGMAAGLFNVGAGIYDSYQNRKTSEENTKRTIEAAKSESELAYQRSVEQWNRQNLYNSPAAQMERFKAAGLNPHLIYGQGNSGNASGYAQYQPANMQYRLEAPQYGAALQSLLPTLLTVGDWMQRMRKSEVDIQKASTDTDKTKQMIDYLMEANPKLLKQMDNKLSLFPYQLSAQRYGMGLTYQKLAEAEAEYRHRYGDSLWKELRHDADVPSQSKIEGIRRLQFLQEFSKEQQEGFKSKLLGAKASWTDFDVTDPQAIMQMVFQSVMGLAGQTLRLSTFKRPKATHEVEDRMTSGRVRIRRRSYE